MTTEKLTQYHAAPSEFAAAPTDADIAAERLRAATAFPAVTPAMVMVYGGAPMMSDDAPADELTGFTYPTRDELAALQDELATLRADNDARGALIEQLRAERDQARENVAAADRRKAALAEALDNMRDERNQAHAAYSRALGELDELRRDLELANDRAELRRALELANDRADRQAAHFLRAEADLARQKRFTALMVQALREMTQGEP